MKLREIFEEAKKRLGSENFEKGAFHRWLIAQGFRFIGAGTTSEAFEHPSWGGVVLKFSEWGVHLIDLDANPNLRPFWLKPLFKSERVMIQPKADTTNRAQNVEISISICEQLGERGHLWDAHPENVGLFRGRKVCFDFLP